MCRRSLLLILPVALLLSSAVMAKDHFLVIGGGYSPSGNQVSLEKNVLLFQEILKEQYPSDSACDIFFSDGDSPNRDLQFRDSSFDLPRLNELLGLVFQKTNDLGYSYRSHEIPSVRGGSNRKNLEKWFNEDAKRVQSGDRLFIYVTAHGGRGANKKEPRNTKLYLWNHENIDTKQFVAMLDKLPADAQVIIVMVQCYSGGFANVVFDGAESKKGASAARRCGFFATVHDRPAAGCTPDIEEANYKEYSTYFWAALRGKSRTGDSIIKPDYDGNGSISFDEAHAYALLESNSIDISVTTSDTYLRTVSRTADKKIKGLLTRDSPLDQLLAVATPAQRAVIDGLSIQLKLKGPARGKETKTLGDRLLAERKKFEKQRNSKYSEYKSLAKVIRTAVIVRWPELSNIFNPQSATILANHGREVQATIEKHAKFKQFEKLVEVIEKLDKQKLDADRRWAKSQRLLRTIENLALVTNLPKVAKPEVQERYRQLISDEAGLFGENTPISIRAPAERAAVNSPAG